MFHFLPRPLYQSWLHRRAFSCTLSQKQSELPHKNRACHRWSECLVFVAFLCGYLVFVVTVWSKTFIFSIWYMLFVMLYTVGTWLILVYPPTLDTCRTVLPSLDETRHKFSDASRYFSKYCSYVTHRHVVLYECKYVWIGLPGGTGIPKRNWESK